MNFKSWLCEPNLKSMRGLGKMGLNMVLKVFDFTYFFFLFRNPIAIPNFVKKGTKRHSHNM